MLRSEDAIEAVDDGLSACLPPSLNESWRDVAKLRLRCQEVFVFLNIDRIRLRGGVVRMLKIKAVVCIREPGTRMDLPNCGCHRLPGSKAPRSYAGRYR